MLRSKYLLSDRDGTLIKHVPFLNQIEHVEICPGVVFLLISASKLNFSFGILTSQTAIGRGIAHVCHFSSKPRGQLAC